MTRRTRLEWTLRTDRRDHRRHQGNLSLFLLLKNALLSSVASSPVLVKIVLPRVKDM